MFDPISSPRASRIRVPGGTRRPPWLQQPRPRPPVHYARTWVVARGPELLRVADKPRRAA